MELNNKELKNITNLARLDLEEKKEEKFFSDIARVVGYFEDLKNVDVSDVNPVTGGTYEINVFRNDNDMVRVETKEGAIIRSFPDNKEGLLKTPHIFDK